jgi:hypothetical protein
MRTISDFRRWLVAAHWMNQASISLGSSVSTNAAVGTLQPDARMTRMLCCYRRTRSAIGSSGPWRRSLDFGHWGMVTRPS